MADINSSIEPEASIAEFVLAQINDSQVEIDRVALAQEEALLNSLGCRADDFPVNTGSPYGDPFGLVRDFMEGRNRSDIISPFSAEQTSSLTTALASPWIGQRDVVYVEADGGAEEANKARLRERAWDKVIRGPYTNWSLAVWQAYREMIVKSRGYLEVTHLKVVEERRVYSYNPVNVAVNAVLSGFMRMLGAAGTTRLSSIQEVTLWDGPIIRCIPFGTVFRDPSESVLSNTSRWVAVKYQWSRAEIEAEGERQFPKGSEIRFSKAILDELHTSTEMPASTGANTNTDAVSTRTPNSDYDMFDVIVWKGIDPAQDANCRYIYWVVRNRCIAAKKHDGSGPWNNIIELAWDPMVDFATSVSPIMLIRRIQEMANTMLGNACDASSWESHPAGLVNELVVQDIDIARSIRPGQYEKKMGEGEAIERIQLAGNSMQTLQEVASLIEMARAGTAGTAQVSGTSPPGVTTATEFSGLSTGALGRLGLQQEINAEIGFKRMFDCVIADLRDSITTDAALQKFVGDDGTLGEVTLEALDDDMMCVPMAARYDAIRQQELTMVSGLIADMKIDPYLAAKLKKEPLYDDYIYLRAGPRGWRWAKTAKEMEQEGLSPQAIEEMQVQSAMASAGEGSGQPSPPKQPSGQPSQVIQPAGGQGPPV